MASEVKTVCLPSTTGYIYNIVLCQDVHSHFNLKILRRQDRKVHLYNNKNLFEVLKVYYNIYPWNFPDFIPGIWGYRI